MDLSSLDIETERLRLRAYRESDAPEIFKAITPEIATYMTFDPAQSVDEIRMVGAKWMDDAAAGREVSATIRQRDGNRFLGMCGIHYRRDPKPGLGIWIRADAHGHGYGREAVVALINFAGTVLGEAAVQYSVAEENVRSRRIPESLGGVAYGSETIQRPSGPPYPGILFRVPTS
ncbi:MAG: GNAT family N-acetyltransferase [Thalassobaculaceae bacterium]|nr:GNAT family N-acetyltransferase [Thalassobaculaceae bacterium]